MVMLTGRKKNSTYHNYKRKEMKKMIKVDIFSGFLGAGKTTLIKKLIEEAYKGEKLVLIENEFGEIGIDGGFLKDAGVEINEMNSGCICCSLVGDFGKALQQVIEQFQPERILIEPSGVGKLSDIIEAVENLHLENVSLNGFTTVVDAKKAKIYMKNFGEFFNNQVEFASSIILSHTAGMNEEKLEKAVALLREHNEHATIIATDWDQLTGKQILEAMEQKDTMEVALQHLEEEYHQHHHHDEECCCGHHDHEHHHHDEEECCCGGHHDHEHHHHDDEECCCGHHDHEHHHHDEEECCCGGHHDHEHHHHDDEECCCGGHHDHEHHHHDEEECCCGHHDHEHHHHDEEGCCCGGNHDHEHHHHHADEVFDSIGMETTKKFTKEKIQQALEALDDEHTYGMILRAKGIVEAEDGTWIHFDYVPGEPDVREGVAGIIGRLCVIGAKVNEEEIHNLFEV